MREQDLAAIKEVLSQRPPDRHRRLARQAYNRPPRRRARPATGAEPRIADDPGSVRIWVDAPSPNATRSAAPVALPPPVPPQTVTLDEPFGLDVWTGPPTQALLDEHLEPGNSWAKIYLKVTQDYGFCYLTFYFVWENTTGADMAINVVTNIGLVATAEASSDPHWIPSAGEIQSGTAVQANATLSLQQWANQAWTSPPFQPEQDQMPIYVRADGGWRLNPFSSTDVEFQSVDGATNLRYRGFTVRRDAVALFEVGLLAQVWLHDDGEGFVDAGHGQNLVGCPSVKLTLPPTTNV